MWRRSGPALAAALAVAAPVHAHHSIAAVYDGGRSVTVEGSVVEFRFVNPHPVLVIDVVGDGATRAWRLEMDNRSELAAIGIEAGTFRPGDAVVATGSPARAEDQALYLRRLDRPADGLRYEQIGSRPQISVKAQD
jgi:hypothetical protein